MEQGDEDLGFSPDIIYDETYMQLDDHFTRNGTGRRPSLPLVPRPTNRLMVQLAVLKERTDSSWDTMTDRFSKLFGDDNSVTRGKLEHKCKKAVDAMKTLPPPEQETFLNQLVIFSDELPEALLKLGLSRQILLNEKPSDFNHSELESTVTNEVILSLESFCIKESLPLTTIYRWVRTLARSDLTEAQIRNKVSNICKCGKKLKKGSKAKLQEFLCKPFLPHPLELENKSVPSGVHEDLKKELAQCKKNLSDVKNENSMLLKQKDLLIEEKSVLINEKGDLLSDIANAKVDHKQVKQLEATKKSLQFELDTLKETKTYRENTKMRQQISELEKKVKTMETQKLNLSTSNKHRVVSELKCKLKREQTSKTEMTSQLAQKTKRNGDSKLAQNGNTAQAETEAVQAELELRKLAFRNPGKFMESFDPEKSSREMKKLKQRMTKDKGRTRAFYDSQGVLYSNGEDWCDCLDISCPGCHFPCPKCESPKCGSECRTNRRWHYQYVMQDWQGEEIIEWPFEPQPFDDGK